MNFFSWRSWFPWNTTPATVPGIPDPEIPRYPPFTEGFPTIDTDRLLASQQQLVDRLHEPLAQDEDTFQKITMPVLRNFCAVVHLLPASASHHHAGPGGLLRHGLEVAFYAVRMTETAWLVGDQPPEDRRALEPVWKFAVFLAGLCHDVGKPLSDMAVTSRDGKTEWNPMQSSLLDWAAANHLDRYFLHWRPGRHKRHEQFSVVAAPRVFGNEALSYLATGGPELLQAVLTAVSGVDDGKVYTMMTRADQESVARDLKNNQFATGGPYGVPVDKFLVDAMRRLLDDGTWKVNEPGARVWVLPEGVYIVWGKASEEIGRLLAKDKTPGVPRGKHSLADVLLERGHAVPHETDRGPVRYWELTPALLANPESDTPPTPMSALRLSDPQLLFEGQVPATVEHWRDDADTSANSEPAAARDAMPATAPSSAASVSGEPAEAALARVPADHDSSPGSEDAPPPLASITRTPTPVQASGSRKPSNGPATDRAAKRPDAATPARRAAAVPTNPSSPVQRPASSAGPSDANAQWFLDRGLAGEFLLRVAEASRHGTFRDGDDYSSTHPVLVVWPGSAKRLGMNTADTLGALRQKGVVQPNPTNPVAPLFMREGLRGVTLSEDAEAHFLAACRSDPGVTRAASQVDSFREALLSGTLSDDTKREGGEVCVNHGAVKLYAVSHGFGAAKDFAVFVQALKADSRFRVVDKRMVCVADPGKQDSVSGGPFS